MAAKLDARGLMSAGGREELLDYVSLVYSVSGVLPRLYCAGKLSPSLTLVGYARCKETSYNRSRLSYLAFRSTCGPYDVEDF